MSPAIVTLDTTPDLDPAWSSAMATEHKTLVLASPALASRQSEMAETLEAAAHSTTSSGRPDLYMLDRLAAGVASLSPVATYDLVLVLSGRDAAERAQAADFLARRDVLSAVAAAMKPRARLRAHDGSPLGPAVVREAILNGLVDESSSGSAAQGVEFTKPEFEEVVVPLRFLGKTKNKSKIVTAPGTAAPIANGGPVLSALTPPPPAAPQVAAPAAAALPNGVVMVDLNDDAFDVSDDDMIDEDELMTEEDLLRPIQQPPECAPQPGKKRKACKDCTCGLAERLEAQDAARRAKADAKLQTIKLASEDLNELDFTVQGKTGSCGSCALGDAFRCADCPYIGLPPFKPGEEVTILNNVAQL